MPSVSTFPANWLETILANVQLIPKIQRLDVNPGQGGRDRGTAKTVNLAKMGSQSRVRNCLMIAANWLTRS